MKVVVEPPFVITNAFFAARQHQTINQTNTTKEKVVPLPSLQCIEEWFASELLSRCNIKSPLQKNLSTWSQVHSPFPPSATITFPICSNMTSIKVPFYKVCRKTNQHEENFALCFIDMEEKQWNIKRVWTVFSFRFLFSYFNLLSLRYVRRLGNDYPSWPADIYAWKHFKMDCRHKNSMRIFPCFIITKWLYCVFKPVFLLWTSVHYSIKKSIVCHFCWRVFESSQASIVWK